MRRGVKSIQTAGAAHTGAYGQGLASGTGAKIHHHLTALGIQQHRQNLRAFVLHFKVATQKSFVLVQRRLARNAQTPGRVRRRQGLDARGRQDFLHIGPLGFKVVHAQIQARALVHLLHQGPEVPSQLVFQGLHQPFRQVMPVALHQIVRFDFFAGVQPVFFLVCQRAAQKVARPVKAQNRQAPLFGAAARGREVVKQEFFA